MNSRVLLIGIIAAMAIWGISWPSTKVLSAYTTPVNLATIRFVFNSIAVCIILLIAKVPLSLNNKVASPLARASILIFLYNYLFFSGIAKGKPGAAGILVTTITPIITYVLAIIINKRPLGSSERVGLLLGLIAGCILVHIWYNPQELLHSGNIFFLFCTITWAFLSRITSTASRYGHPLAFTFWMYVICTLLLLCIADVPACISVIQQADNEFWINIIFNSVINSGMATMFYFYATSKLGAERTSSFTFVVPFSAAISSYLILGEVLAWNTIVGGIIGLAAVYLLNFKAINKRVKAQRQ
jgi:drug/metabolite transporter (DMT)-like permease